MTWCTSRGSRKAEIRAQLIHGGEPRGLIVAECLQAFKLQVTTPQLPLVVLLEKECADQTHDRRFALSANISETPAFLEISSEVSRNRTNLK